MKNYFLLIFFLFTSLAYSQVSEDLEPFWAIQSNISADIEVHPATSHRLEITGKPSSISQVRCRIIDNRLEIFASDPDLKDIHLKIFTPSIKAVDLKNGGKFTWDNQAYAEMDNFVVSVEKGAIAELSETHFENLVTRTDNTSKVHFKSADVLVSSSENGKQIIIYN